jgi:hypothetical protein
MKQTKSNTIERKKAKAQAPADPRDGLTDRQRRAVLAVLEAPNMEAAARAAGVVKSTLYEWIRLPAFRAQLEAGRVELYRAGIDRLKGAADKAAAVLIALLESRNENTRRLTAVGILAAGMKIAEAQDIEARIERLEQYSAALAEGGGTPGAGPLSMKDLNKSMAAYKAAGD